MNDQTPEMATVIVDQCTEIGLDAGSSYVETYWLPTLGPTAWAMLRLLHREPGRHATVDLARLLGVQGTKVRTTLKRLEKFGLLRLVRATPVQTEWRLMPVPQCPARMLARLPLRVQARHVEQWATAQ